MSAITVLDFSEVTDALTGDILYLLRGVDLTRDKKIQLQNICPLRLDVSADNGAFSLTGYQQGLIVFVPSTVTENIDITFTGTIKAGRRIEIVNDSGTYVVNATFPTLGAIAVPVGSRFEAWSDGTNFYEPSTLLGVIKVDTIGERTGSAKTTFTNGIKTDTIDEKTGAAGVTIDSVLLKDGKAVPPNGLTKLGFFDSPTIGGSQDALFDALAPFVPNTNDERLASGGLFVTSAVANGVVCKIKRTSSTVIDLTYQDGSSGGEYSLNDGSATAIGYRICIF